ncbi:MAG: hypothetical protein JNJ41_10110 [Bacteroidia bacterium]|nr:hypothetical protein [Bacteroidia bacterium]
MDKIENIQIINGLFIPENAKEVLLDLISSKIEFHKRHKYKGDVLFSEERINELQKIRDLIMTITNTAIKNKKKIVVEGIINLKMID